MENLEQNLETYGLDSRESQIYVFLLKNKDIPVTLIQKETVLPRATIYKILDKLSHKGLVTSWTKNNVRHYSAESPHILEKTIENRRLALNEVMPELTRLFGINTKNPTSKLYIGKDGVKTAYEIILEKLKQHRKTRILVYTDGGLVEILPKFYTEWKKKRDQTGAFTELLTPAKLSIERGYQSDPFREVRYMQGDLPFKGSFNVVDSLVIFFSFKEENTYSVVIDSPVIAEMMTGIFKYFWNTLGNR